MGMWPFLKLFSNLCLNWAISAGRVWMYKQMHHDSQMHFNSDYNTHKYKDYCMMGRLCKNLQHFMPMPDFVKNCWPGLECVHPQAAKRPVALDVERFTHRPVRAAAGPSPAGDLATTALWPPTSHLSHLFHNGVIPICHFDCHRATSKCPLAATDCCQLLEKNVTVQL